MHHRLLVTFTPPANADSAAVRSEAYNRLMADDSFCGEGGRFGHPLADWFVIGGRWSGLLAEIAIGKAYKEVVHARFPGLAREWFPHSLVEKHGAELDALWQAHGGIGESPYTRSGYEGYGAEDDAALLTRALFDGFLAEYEGESACRGEYADLDDEELSADFIDRKWLVLIDYHN